MGEDARSAKTRQDLLEAGLELLREKPTTETLNARTVSRKAGKSTGAFYYYWDSQDDYLTDLVALGLAERRYRWLRKLERRVRKLAAEEASLETVIEKAARWGIESVEDDPMFLVQMSVWSRHAVDPQSKRALAQLYRDFHAHFLPLYHDVLGGREPPLEPRPPFTYESLAVAVTALVEGLVLQRRVDKESVPIELFGWILFAIAALAVRPVGDQRDLRESLAAVVAAAWAV